MKYFVIILTLLMSSVSYATSLAVTPAVFKSVTIKEVLPFKLTLLHLDLKKDNQALEEFVGLGAGIKEKLPIMGSIYYQGQCIVFMQEKGITSYYKKLGINNKTVDISVYHEIGHCFTSQVKEDKQYYKLHRFNITSEESADAISETEEYAQYVERYGDIYALAYIATHHKNRLDASVKYLTMMRGIDATEIYNTQKGIDRFKTEITFKESVADTAFEIMHNTY